jgi:hypothetical protein
LHPPRVLRGGCSRQLCAIQTAAVVFMRDGVTFSFHHLGLPTTAARNGAARRPAGPRASASCRVS